MNGTIKNSVLSRGGGHQERDKVGLWLEGAAGGRMAIESLETAARHEHLGQKNKANLSWVISRVHRIIYLATKTISKTLVFTS